MSRRTTVAFHIPVHTPQPGRNVFTYCGLPINVPRRRQIALVDVDGRGASCYRCLLRFAATTEESKNGGTTTSVGELVCNGV